MVTIYTGSFPLDPCETALTGKRIIFVVRLCHHATTPLRSIGAGGGADRPVKRPVSKPQLGHLRVNRDRGPIHHLAEQAPQRTSCDSAGSAASAEVSNQAGEPGLRSSPTSSCRRTVFPTPNAC